MWNKAILVLGPLLITGCGLTQVQKDSIGQFSRASASFSESVSIQLTDARSTVLELNTSVLSLRAKQDNSLDKVDGSFSPERISARIRAAETLQSYAQLLLALVEDTQQKEIQNAATKFKESIRGLDQDGKRISNEQLTILGELVQDIGGLIVEHKKKTALEKILPAAHEQVKAITELFASEFNIDGAVAKNVNAMGLLTVSTADRILDDKSSNVQDSVIAATANSKGLETKRKTDAIYPSIAVAARQLEASHQEISKAVGSDKLTFDQLNSLTKTVADVVSKTQLMLKK